jgi:AraC-like DNA-binding protein
MERLTNIVNREIANENFSVDEIAREMLVNRTTFYDRVKTLTGMAPNAYLRTVRMKRAAEMLSTTDTPVSEVAYSVGFSSPQYFSKVFKQEFDMTPTDYINKFRGKMD